MITSVAASIIPARHLCISLFRPSYSGRGDNRWKWPKAGQLRYLLSTNIVLFVKFLVCMGCRQLRARVQTIRSHCLETSRHVLT